MVILITGATGFVMSALARHLAEHGHHVIAADLEPLCQHDQGIPRPDLAAHDYATRAPLSFVVKELTDLLGARLVAYIAGVTETRAVHGWAREGRAPKDPQVPDRLRLALRVAKLISDHDTPQVAQAWLQGLNPRLSDRSPARLLREGDLSDVGPEIVLAARAFVIGG